MRSSYPWHSTFTPFARRFTDERARDLSETVALHNEVTDAHRATIYSRSDAIQRFSTAIATAVAEEQPVPDSPSLLKELDDCLTGIIAMETTIFSTPRVDFAHPLTLKEQVDLRRFLRAQQYFLAHHERITERFVAALVGLFSGIIRSIPNMTEGSFTVPLINLIRNPHELVDAIIGSVCDDDLSQVGLLADLQDRLYTNVMNASGIQIGAKSRKPIITAAKSALPPLEMAQTYLDGTPFLDLLLAPASIEIPQEQRFSGHWIIAPPGRGKTTLLHAMFLDDLRRDASIIIMDSKGDLIGPIKKMQQVADRFVLIEPNSEYPLALNPLDVPRTNIAHTVSLLEYVFSALLEAKATALQTTLFRNVLPALVSAIPDATLFTFKDIMINGFAKYEQYIQNLDPDIQDFIYNQFSTKTYAETRTQLVWRIDYLMTNPFIKSMFSAIKTRLDIGKEMDAGKIIIINNSAAILGDEGSEFFGRFFIALILAAAQQRAQRPQHEKLPVFVYIDECHTVISRDEKVAAIIDQCRSQRIALILAHQRTNQIVSENVRSALANCAIRFANSDDEAKLLADKLRTTPEFLRSLEVGTFAAFIRDFTKTALSLNVPRYDLSRLPQLTGEEQRQIRDRMRADFSIPPRLAAPPRPRPPLTVAVPSTQAARTAKQHVAPQPKRGPNTTDRGELTGRAGERPTATGDDGEAGKDW